MPSPGNPGNIFNETFLHDSPNFLEHCLPAEAKFAKVVQVLDVKSISQGRLLNIDMDGDAQEALGYLV